MGNKEYQLDKNYILFVIKHIALYSVIAFSVWLLKSGWPLLALLCTSSYKNDNDEN